jgi:glycosyltransferase involved in cell wall biosynthesis
LEIEICPFNFDPEIGHDEIGQRKENILKILYFGIYSKGVEYPRNKNLIRALNLSGVEVVEAHVELAESFDKRINAITKPIQTINFFIGLLVSFLALSWKFINAPAVDYVIVGHPGSFHIHLAYILCRIFKRKAFLVYDVFIPIYEALVEDRKLVTQDSTLGRWLYRFERSCCGYADLCLVDTEAHRRYLSDMYGVPKERISRIFVGPTIEKQIHPIRIRAETVFKVLFVGTYIPLHGINTILEAARYLQSDQSMQFVLVGTGQLRQEIEKLAHEWNLTNVIFHDWIPTSNLGQFISSFDLALGIFGVTSKAASVIPSKIYDICAVGIPFITSETPAINEVFSHEKNAYLIPSGDSRALAEAIVYLKGSSDLRRRIAEGARQIGKGVFSLSNIGKEFIEEIQKINKKI